MEQIEAWLRESPPLEIVGRLVAEQVRILLAAGRTQDAIDLAATSIQKLPVASGELAFANLEASLAAARAAQRAGRSTDSSVLTAMVDAIGKQHGAYWARRAQLLAGGAASRGQLTGGDARALVLAAEHRYFNGDIDGAIAAYDRAIERLDQERQTEPAFATAMTAAAIEREAGRTGAAARRYQKVALAKPDHPRAAEAHRLAILCAADGLREAASTDRPGWSTLYEQLLDEHLNRWPSSGAAAEVRLWRGQWLAGRLDFRGAIEVLQAVPPTAQQAIEAMRLTARSYERWAESLAAGDGDHDAVATRTELLKMATNQLQPLVTGPDNRWPATWNDLARETALELAKLHLRYPEGSATYAEQLLAAALGGTAASLDAKRNAQWEAAARAQLVVALARNGKAPEARALVPQLAAAPTERLVELVAQLVAGAELATSEGESRPAMGQLALATIRLLEARASELNAATIARLDRYRAAAMAFSGDRREAIAHLRELASRSPDDGDLQERLAVLLTESDSPDDRRHALGQWQQVEQRSRRGGPRWRRARQARIDLLMRSGNQAEADKLLRLTRLLYPDWD
jgi:hypothetical protein